MARRFRHMNSGVLSAASALLFCVLSPSVDAYAQEASARSPRRVVFIPHFYLLAPIADEPAPLPPEEPSSPPDSEPPGDTPPEEQPPPEGEPRVDEDRPPETSGADGEERRQEGEEVTSTPAESGPDSSREASEEEQARAFARRPALEGAMTYASNHPELFALVPGRVLQERLTEREDIVYMQSLQLARGFASIGLEKYKELDLVETIRYLEQARAAYAQLHHEYVLPEEVADVLLYLALSYLEQGNQPTRAVNALQEMILMAPERELKPGYYTPSVVAAYRDAREALVRELDRRGLPLILTERAPSIARLTGAQTLVFGFVLPSGAGRWRLKLFFWSSETKRVEQTDELVVSSIEGETLREAANMLVARYADCLREVPEEGVDPIAPARGTSPVSVDMNFSYATFLQFPQVKSWPYRNDDDGNLRHFGNYGLNVGVQWALRREFRVVSRFQLLTSQRDFSGLLDAQDVLTLRGLLGGEVGFRFGLMRAALQIAADFTHLSDFSIQRNLSCGAGQDSDDCSRDIAYQTYDDYDLLFGVNATPSISYNLYRTLDLVAMTSISYFFASTAETNEVNLPWSGELGFRYRF